MFSFYCSVDKTGTPVESMEAWKKRSGNQFLMLRTVRTKSSTRRHHITLKLVYLKLVFWKIGWAFKIHSTYSSKRLSAHWRKRCLQTRVYSSFSSTKQNDIATLISPGKFIASDHPVFSCVA